MLDHLSVLTMHAKFTPKTRMQHFVAEHADHNSPAASGVGALRDRAGLMPAATFVSTVSSIMPPLSLVKTVRVPEPFSMPATSPTTNFSRKGMASFPCKAGLDYLSCNLNLSAMSTDLLGEH